MSKRPKVVLANIWHNRIEHTVNIGKHVCVWGTFVLVALSCMLANQAGWFEFSHQTIEPYANTAYTLRVQEHGRTTYEAVEALHGASLIIDREAKEELLSTVYPSPEAAMEATDVKLAGNVAWAHAVNVCWNGPGAKYSRQTGTGRHATVHRYDRGGYRYTKTAHQHLNFNSWQTDQVYKFRTRLSNC